jgi:succinate dehydrogenase / fumarate reductase flavoprotein subunit
VSRTFYARGQTGQQLLLGCYQALCRQITAGTVQMFPQTEMLDLVIVGGHAKGIVTRSLRSGKIDRRAADAVVLATGGYGNVFYLSTNARGCNVTATYRAYKRGALFANPAFTQIHHHPSQWRISIRHADVQSLERRTGLGANAGGPDKPPSKIRGGSRLPFERKYPSAATSRHAYCSTRGEGGLRRGPRRRPGGRGVYLDLPTQLSVWEKM